MYPDMPQKGDCGGGRSVRPTVNIVLCGLGGQGIVFMTKVLAQAGLDRGFDVMGAETHGMAQRGGSVVSHLRFGDVAGSLVRTHSAQFLIALEENEAYRNLPFLMEGGTMVANADSERFPVDKVRVYLERKQITCHSVSAEPLLANWGLVFEPSVVGFFRFDDALFSHAELEPRLQRSVLNVREKIFGYLTPV
jgi:indolepyruvate ferredoxin oxidoreductase beta subunit